MLWSLINDGSRRIYKKLCVGECFIKFNARGQTNPTFKKKVMLDEMLNDFNKCVFTWFFQRDISFFILF